ncbi:uncharacterized GPI-anchored protein At3g06035-like [Phalaenopsis equestris]|uniref:uncharacterized GPI-anchored protein At3g06035-like n=1 Tax=Phalaenopsis equestris TaxID=78828 RepID=UPI0009E1B1D0|nr:uncharacterized GPI-anchored protein At3g06035-like [Phalaenopsis equestris]
MPDGDCFLNPHIESGSVRHSKFRHYGRLLSSVSWSIRIRRRRRRSSGGGGRRRRELFLKMASLVYYMAFLTVLNFARSDDSTDQLLKGLNAYRTSLKLSPLTENENAECLAEQIAKQFEDQPCSNTTGANTVPGTEEQFPNFPDFLTKCHLNATVTQDASIMPVCVPDLRSDLVLSNYTKTQYSGSLNDSKFTGAGLADEGDWVVVVLSTNTSTGNFSPATGSDSGSGSSSVHACALSFYLTVLFLELLVLMK